MVCGSCKFLQDPGTEPFAQMNFFEIFSRYRHHLPNCRSASYEVDLEDLQSVYVRLQMKFHPDKYQKFMNEVLCIVP